MLRPLDSPVKEMPTRITSRCGTGDVLGTWCGEDPADGAEGGPCRPPGGRQGQPRSWRTPELAWFAWASIAVPAWDRMLVRE
ncbi:hypothetical protein Ccel01_07380 [Cellulosimicrobium cellulans]|uniref:Uncharacterized protein n=1 Tax=Cellulosimicrobium cellulans TaxID=1710 RepID=A0AAV5P4H4_CELCE|nr:hypothetical protein Ccel01_07380 [Cellulosimicrobium cellulans]